MMIITMYTHTYKTLCYIEHNINFNECTRIVTVSCVCATDPSYTCKNGSIRLRGGDRPSEGRVEVCVNNHYGTVCGDHWDNRDAGVVCRTLGYQADGEINCSGMLVEFVSLIQL